MAEINVEHKRKVWPWILGLLAVLFVLWAIAEIRDNDDAAVAPTAATAPATTEPGTYNRPATTDAAPRTTGDASEATTQPSGRDATEDTTPPPP